MSSSIVSPARSRNEPRSRRATCRLTDEQRAKKRAAERERMERAVEELRSSEGWQAWLQTRSRFHRYSLSNQLLIAFQSPTATRVAGFRKWLELGYCVRKGEHALYIWAPCPPSKKEIEEARGRGEEPRSTFFKMAPVFGDDQVDPLPPPVEPQPIHPPVADIEGDDLEPVWQPLVELAASVGSEVEIGWTEPAHGYYDPATRKIVVSDRLSVNGRVKTLVHELAHALLRVEPRPDEFTLTYAQEELVVESIAFSVTGTLGLDTGGYSIPYLTSWSERTDIGVVKQTAMLIDALASRIEDAIPAEVPS